MPNKKKLGSKPKRNPGSEQKLRQGGKAEVSAKTRHSTPKRSSKTSRVKAKIAVKKLAAPKTKAAPESTMSTAGQVSPGFARMAVADVAPQKACLPLPPVAAEHLPVQHYRPGRDSDQASIWDLAAGIQLCPKQRLHWVGVRVQEGVAEGRG
jgi:hypothetical protein